MSSDISNEEETDRVDHQSNRWPSILSSLLNSSRPQNDKSAAAVAEEAVAAEEEKMDDELAW